MESPKLRSNCCGPVLLLLVQLISMVRSSDAEAGQLMWSPSPNATGPSEGMQAFEGVEDDRNHTEPGVKHIFVEGDHYRVNMDLKVRDTLAGRQRNEVKGMTNTSGNAILVLEGETWRLEHSLYIPSSLKATTSFTHIMQLKKPGPGSSPILTMSLLKTNGEPTIALHIFANNFILVSTALTPLQNTWIHSSLTFNASTNGAIQWNLTDSKGQTVVDAQGQNQPLFIGDRVRPKWGIYRSLKDTADLEDCYLLLKNFQAFKLS